MRNHVDACSVEFTRCFSIGLGWYCTPRVGSFLLLATGAAQMQAISWEFSKAASGMHVASKQLAFLHILLSGGLVPTDQQTSYQSSSTEPHRFSAALLRWGLGQGAQQS